MKTKKKIIFFLALLSLFYCITLMQKTYAKYVTNASASADLTIARWSILLNNQDIIQNSDFSETITPVFAGTTNIKADVIAPTAEGYFDVTLDGSNTDVSFNYTIHTDLASTNTVSDLQISRYVIDDVSYEYDGSDLTGTVLLNDENKVKTIRFYVKWNDDTATENMNNEADSLAANEGIAAFDIDLNVIQLR